MQTNTDQELADAINQVRIVEHNVRRWQRENAERKRRQQSARQRDKFRRSFNRVIVEIAA